MVLKQVKIAALAGAAVAVALPAGVLAQSSNPGRDYNYQLYERRYDPGAYSSPPYYRQSPAQQYNQQLYERRYRAPSAAERERAARRAERLAEEARERGTGQNSPRVKSVKPSRKTEEQVRRAQRNRDDED